MMQRTLAKQLGKIVDRNIIAFENLQERIEQILNLEKDEHEQAVLIAICTSIILGLETKEERELVANMTLETVKNYKE